VGLRAPHPRFLFWRKRGTRKQRHALFGQIPNDCRFSWRRSQSGSLRSGRSAYSLLVQPTAPLTRPEKRQGDLTSFATVACGEPLGCASLSLQPEPRVVGAGRLQKQALSRSLSRVTPQPTPQPALAKGGWLAEGETGGFRGQPSRIFLSCGLHRHPQPLRGSSP